MVIRDNGWDSQWDYEPDMTESDYARRAIFLEDQRDRGRQERSAAYDAKRADERRKREERERPARIAAQKECDRKEAAKQRAELLEYRLFIAWYIFLGLVAVSLMSYCEHVVNAANR